MIGVYYYFKMQPLDVAINRPFKEEMQRLWCEWMIDGQHTYTPTGRQRRCDVSIICEWIIQAWASISKQTIINGFLKCCISNALDGSQDDKIWKYDCMNQSDDNMDVE